MLLPCRLATTVVGPGCQRLEGEDAGKVLSPIVVTILHIFKQINALIYPGKRSCCTYSTSKVPGDVDVGHARLGEEAGEDGVEADHVEQVHSVVSLHFLHVCHVLTETSG